MTRGLAVCALVVAGCSSGGGGNGAPPTADLALATEMPGFTLNGTLAGYVLSSELHSAEVHTVNDTGVLSAVVNFSNRARFCELEQVSPSCTGAGRILSLRVGGTDPGSFTVVNQEKPGRGQARLAFFDLDAQCFENTSVSATSGTVTVGASDLTVGGLYTFSFEVVTPDGPASGQATVAFCQI